MSPWSALSSPCLPDTVVTSGRQGQRGIWRRGGYWSSPHARVSLTVSAWSNHLPPLGELLLPRLRCHPVDLIPGPPHIRRSWLPLGSTPQSRASLWCHSCRRCGGLFPRCGLAFVLLISAPWAEPEAWHKEVSGAFRNSSGRGLASGLLHLPSFPG